MYPEMYPSGWDSYSCFLGFVAVSVSVAFLLLLKGKDGANKKGKLPPGGTGWPIIGETITFYRDYNSPQPRRFSDDHERRYGPIFRCNLFGNAQTVLSIDPEFNKYVLQNEGRLFKSRYPYSTRNLIGKYGLLEVHGELQRKLHGMAANLMKYDTLTTDFQDDIEHVFLTGMKKWESQRDIPLQPSCHQVVLNLMGRKLLSLPPAEEMQEIYEAFNIYVKAILCLPLNIPGTAYAKGVKARKTIIKKVHQSIEERRQHPEVVYNDLLAKLLREGTYSEEIIADMILFLLFAGYETSSTIMSFAVKYITHNPRALEELRAEHDALLKAKGNEKLTMDDFKSMKFTHCVIKETLRLTNVASITFRETKQDIKVKDFVIPKGWTVVILLSGTHLDERHYPEPLKFDPWRWENEGYDLSKDSSFMPFGKGARLCPGYHLARFEIALFLHSFLTKFRWEPLEVGPDILFPLPHMAKGFPIRLSPR
uniref:TSA: Wollemia nobilis Ref_Wollemi_Transcript_14644_1927 transcribed RNA sequence n=1 Tax=Wollemia nobilis TaxID=56998 RepID=A0A0C9QPK2_9CONI